MIFFSRMSTINNIDLKFPWRDTWCKMNETRLQQPWVVPSWHVLLWIVKWFKNMGCSLRLARYFSRSLREKFSLALACPISRSLPLALAFASGSTRFPVPRFQRHRASQHLMPWRKITRMILVFHFARPLRFSLLHCYLLSRMPAVVFIIHRHHPSLFHCRLKTYLFDESFQLHTVSPSTE